MYSIWIFDLFPKYSLNFVKSFSELSREEFHEEHEDIASYFQSLHLPQTIDTVYELATSNFEKYQWDDNFALVRKCCFAWEILILLRRKKNWKYCCKVKKRL